jgi:hypothetical protein
MSGDGGMTLQTQIISDAFNTIVESRGNGETAAFGTRGGFVGNVGDWPASDGINVSSDGLVYHIHYSWLLK